MAERRRQKQAPYAPTAPRLAGFGAGGAELPTWSKNTNVLPHFRMYLPRARNLELPRGCTLLSFLQVAAADIIVVDQLTDMDTQSSDHVAT